MIAKTPAHATLSPRAANATYCNSSRFRLPERSAIERVGGAVSSKPYRRHCLDAAERLRFEQHSGRVRAACKHDNCVGKSSPMLVVMNANATDAEIAAVVRVIESLGLRPHTMPGATRTAIGVTGNQGAVDLRQFEYLSVVADAIRVRIQFK